MRQRWAAKKDSTQSDIVKGLRQAGVLVWIIGWPADLLCYVHGRFQVLEIKTPYGKRQPKARKRKEQESQHEFLSVTATPTVTCLSEALQALGVQNPPMSVRCTSKPTLVSTVSADTITA